MECQIFLKWMFQVFLFFVCRLSRVHVVLESAGAGLDWTGAGVWCWWIVDWAAPVCYISSSEMDNSQ